MSDWQWFDKGDGRQVMRKVRNDPPPARSHLPTPVVIGDNIELKSMADGKIYTSKAALRASYLPSGNPQGERYIEVGDEWDRKPPSPPKPKVDRKGIRESVGKALSKVGVPV